ncbi:hypothetical protein AJGP001_13580 [Planococcus faecalis]|uniref:Uncharacterized protein n=1 Tax=Planococcus faecalis TaxID=1598147 RepID=A0ABM6IVY7_9BACL|nr:hypothetical protein AJGP001_13580 [Planococcus faecalis]
MGFWTSPADAWAWLGWVLWDRLSELILFGLGSGCRVLESLGGGGARAGAFCVQIRDWWRSF